MENCFLLLCLSRSEDLYRNSDMILPAKLRQASQKRHFPRVYAFYLGPIQETEGSVFPANFKGLDAIANCGPSGANSLIWIFYLDVQL